MRFIYGHLYPIRWNKVWIWVTGSRGEQVYLWSCLCTGCSVAHWFLEKGVLKWAAPPYEKGTAQSAKVNHNKVWKVGPYHVVIVRNKEIFGSRRQATRWKMCIGNIYIVRSVQMGNPGLMLCGRKTRHLPVILPERAPLLNRRLIFHLFLRTAGRCILNKHMAGQLEWCGMSFENIHTVRNCGVSPSFHV